MFRLLLLIVAVAGITSANAQPQDRMPITEGTEFLVGFIHPEPVAPEKALPEGNELIITSTIGARVSVGGAKTVVIGPGQVVREKIGMGDVLNITSDRPIAVATFQHYIGNGEMAWHVPVSMWGTAYHPFAWWQDGFGLANQPYYLRTAKIRVIAARDHTRITTAREGVTPEVTLQAGQSWLIDLPVDSGGTRLASTDPTGMAISADGPIGIISGHAKGAVLRYPDAMPDTGAYARHGNFMRSNFHDAMLPDVMAGTRFVTAPLIYSPTRLRGTDQTRIGVEDDRGDVIRFVGLTDGTLIRRNGEAVATIDAGGTWMDQSCEQGVVWTPSYPVLCAQYGKSYARITSQASKPEDDPSTDAGLPLLQVVPSEDRWVTSATFTALPDFTNAVTIVGTVDALKTIKLDTGHVSAGSPVRTIGTSSYGYITTYLTEGTHRLFSEDPSHRFMAWTYGSIDGLQPARIYGSVASMNMAWDCIDSVVTSMRTTQDSIIITYGVTAPERSSCAAVALAYAERCDGGIVARRGDSLVIVRATPTTMVDGEAIIAARSGRYVRVPFHLDGTTSVTDRNDPSLSVEAVDGALQIISAQPIMSNVMLFDVTGALLLSLPGNASTSMHIDCTSLARGVYVVLTNDTARRVIIE
ncbi:MAG: hypothetical protein FGM24_06230 [Candidatus Kapabacteria bacterium]|nr:hypothetical protein [Candidatus Kapabacteria bacterium]